MKLPKFKRLVKTDFSEEFQDLVEKLSFSLNSGIESLYDVLDNKLSLSDNLACVIKDIQLSTVSGIPETNVTIQLASTFRVIGTEVIKVENLTNTGAYPLGGVTITWAQSQKGLIINHITGLRDRDTYRIRLVIYS